MGFFSMWARLPLWVRIPGGLIVMLIGAGMIYSMEVVGRGSRGGTVIGILLAFAGMAMIFNGPSDAEKRGYHDV